MGQGPTNFICAMEQKFRSRRKIDRKGWPITYRRGSSQHFHPVSASHADRRLLGVGGGQHEALAADRGCSAATCGCAVSRDEGMAPVRWRLRAFHLLGAVRDAGRSPALEFAFALFHVVRHRWGDEKKPQSREQSSLATMFISLMRGCPRGGGTPTKDLISLEPKTQPSGGCPSAHGPNWQLSPYDRPTTIRRSSYCLIVSAKPHPLASDSDCTQPRLSCPSRLALATDSSQYAGARDLVHFPF